MKPNSVHYWLLVHLYFYLLWGKKLHNLSLKYTDQLLNHSGQSRLDKCKISCSSWYFSSYTTLLSDLTKLKRFKYINQSFRCTIRSLSTKNTWHVFSIRSLIYLMVVFYFFHYDWSYFLMLFYESLLICFDDWVSKFHIL